MLLPHLNQATARLIVQRAMRILNYSVNVMNEQGIIIASGDPKRLQQKHEGAVLALTENRMVEIDDKTAKLLKGVKPGINLPIVFHDKIVGVVGISGQPEDVRKYAELVRMATELVLEQVEILEKSQWEKRYRDELVTQLISTDKDNRSIQSIGAYLDIDLNKPRIALLLALNEPDYDAFHHLVEYLDGLKMDLLVAINGINEIVVLKPMLNSHDEMCKQLGHFYRQLQSQFALKMYVGGLFNGSDGLHRSYQSAKAMCSLGQQTFKRQKILYYDDHKLSALLNGLQNTWQLDELTKSWRQLKAADTRNQLCHTLKVYFDQNCDLSQSTKKLHIHVNTLRYRLQRIEDITGLNINALDSSLQLYIGMLTDD